MKKLIEISRKDYKLIVLLNNILFRFNEYERHIPVFILGNKYYAFLEEK